MENENLPAENVKEKERVVSAKFNLTLIQLVLCAAAILIFWILKSFFPDTYYNLKNEYQSRMNDSIFAENDEGVDLIE